LSIGVAVANGTTSVLIPRGTVRPMKKVKTTSTSKDNQTNVKIEIVEGERKMAKDNKKLGCVVVDGIEAAPQGVAKIQLTIEINVDGLLRVTAVDQNTGQRISATIQSGSNLSQQQLDGILADVAAHKIEDERRYRRAQWKSKLSLFVDRLPHLTIANDRCWAKLTRHIQGWNQWINNHQSDPSGDVFIKQYFEVRKKVNDILNS
jgi:molecular chaperone DnaK (HSP70)